MTRCVGHRGAAGLAPENSLAAYRAGIAAGADAVECDVHCTLDGHLVLMHDADVSRTTDGSGTIGTMRLAAVQRLNCAAKFGDGFFEHQQVPSLESLLELAHGRCAVQVEIKVPDGVPYDGIERLVIRALRDHDSVETAQVICFDAATLLRVHALDPRLELGYLASRSSLPPELRGDPVALIRRAENCGARFLGLDRQLVAAEHLRGAKAHGLAVAVWTVNDPLEMAQMVSTGMDGITSDRPDVLRHVLDTDARRP
ncbi:MAG TPA: glycerophosphodiester phosphodiesterase [Chloroflexota bacterium]|jgi:glycerophosphoryl diester phosphodiesterase